MLRRLTKTDWIWEAHEQLRTTPKYLLNIFKPTSGWGILYLSRNISYLKWSLSLSQRAILSLFFTLSSLRSRERNFNRRIANPSAIVSPMPLFCWSFFFKISSQHWANGGKPYSKDRHVSKRRDMTEICWEIPNIFLALLKSGIFTLYIYNHNNDFTLQGLGPRSHTPSTGKRNSIFSKVPP